MSLYPWDVSRPVAPVVRVALGVPVVLVVLVVLVVSAVLPVLVALGVFVAVKALLAPLGLLVLLVLLGRLARQMPPALLTALAPRVQLALLEQLPCFGTKATNLRRFVTREAQKNNNWFAQRAGNRRRNTGDGKHRRKQEARSPE